MLAFRGSSNDTTLQSLVVSDRASLMPNLASNRMILRGPAKGIDSFLDTCCSKTEDGTPFLDFERLVPTPRVLEGLHHSTDAEIAIEIATRKPRKTLIGEQTVL